MRLTLTRFRTLVSTKWLHERLSKPSNLRILDASATHDRTEDGYAEFYLKSHIPHASYFHLHNLCPASPSSLEKYPVPDLNRFQDYAESLGVSSDTHVVAYDRSNTTFALKTWWLFRLFGHSNVSVLDGGFKKWQADGFETSTEEPVVERCSFHASFNLALLHRFEDMVKNVKTQDRQMLDGRGEEAFHNRKPEQIGGHIPGARNIPYRTLFLEDGTFKAPEELKKVFDAAGVDFSRPVVTSCQTAMTACGLAAAAHILGKEDVAVYNGSFREWSQRAEPDQIEVD